MSTFTQWCDKIRRCGFGSRVLDVSRNKDVTNKMKNRMHVFAEFQVPTKELLIPKGGQVSRSGSRPGNGFKMKWVIFYTG